MIQAEKDLIYLEGVEAIIPIIDKLLGVKQ